MNAVLSPLQLFLLGLETIAGLATNPVLGLGQSFGKIALLVETLTGIFRKGEAAVPELIEFTDEIKRLGESPDPIPEEVWARIRTKREAQHAEIQSYKD